MQICTHSCLCRWKEQQENLCTDEYVNPDDEMSSSFFAQDHTWTSIFVC
jgi:hypothetical protein